MLLGVLVLLLFSACDDVLIAAQEASTKLNDLIIPLAIFIISLKKSQFLLDQSTPQLVEKLSSIALQLQMVSFGELMECS